MIANHIHDALAQVRRLQGVLLEKRQFKGYSGTARVVCGFVALGAAWFLSGAGYRDPFEHLFVWGIVVLIGAAVNYGALAYWFLFDDHVRRNLRMLKPAGDAIPALAVGGAMTIGLVLVWQFNLLFGMWMCLYGLAQVAYRQSLPSGIYLVGLGYIICGAVCLAWPDVSFLRPWPMGVVFFVGEVIGGWILIRQHVRDV